MKTWPVVVGAGLVTSAGDRLVDCAQAFDKSRRCFVRPKNFIGPDGGPPTLAFHFPPQSAEYGQRLFDLFAAAFEDCLNDSAATLPPPRIYMAVLLAEVLHGTTVANDLVDAIRAKLHGYEIEIFYGGSARTVSLLGETLKKLERQYDGAYLCAVDSHIEPDLLDRLYAQELGFHAGNPYGFIPGEGAACIYMEARNDARGRGQILALSYSAGAATKDGPTFDRSLIKVLRDVVPRSLDGDARVWADLSGPRWRAEQYGMAVAGLGGRLQRSGLDPSVASLCFGEMGTADFAARLALALALKPRTNLLIAMDEGGARGALLIEAFARERV